MIIYNFNWVKVWNGTSVPKKKKKKDFEFCIWLEAKKAFFEYLRFLFF